MDALRLKCNKVREGSRRERGEIGEETTGSSGRTLWTKGEGGGGSGGGSVWTHTVFPDTQLEKRKRQTVCFYSGFPTRLSVSVTVSIWN